MLSPEASHFLSDTSRRRCLSRCVKTPVPKGFSLNFSRTVEMRELAMLGPKPRFLRHFLLNSIGQAPVSLLLLRLFSACAVFADCEGFDDINGRMLA